MNIGALDAGRITDALRQLAFQSALIGDPLNEVGGAPDVLLIEQLEPGTAPLRKIGLREQHPRARVIFLRHHDLGARGAQLVADTRFVERFGHLGRLTQTDALVQRDPGRFRRPDTDADDRCQNDGQAAHQQHPARSGHTLHGAADLMYQIVGH